MFFFSNSWIIDSGATDHVSFFLKNFFSYHYIDPILVKLLDGSQTLTKIVGIVVCSNNPYLTEVLYIPSFTFNLLSVSKATKQLNYHFFMTDMCCEIQDRNTSKMIGCAKESNGLYTLRVSPLCSQTTTISASIPYTSEIFKTAPQISLQSQNTTKAAQHSTHHTHMFSKYSIGNNSKLWHLRLRHVPESISIVIKKDFPFIKCISYVEPCDPCHFGKQKKLSFTRSITQSSKAFDLVHLDIWVPLAIPSIDGHRYFLTIVDDKTRFTWVHFFKLKSEVPILVKNFVTHIETQFEKIVKCFRSDNGPEFNLISFFEEKGIIHQTSYVETPQQNGVIERKHQHLLGMARALLFHSSIPKSFWTYAVSHAAFLINRLPSIALKDIAPYELFFF